MCPHMLSMPSKSRFLALLSVSPFFVSLCVSIMTISIFVFVSVLLKWGWLQSFSTWSAQRSCLACGRGFHRWVKCIGWCVHFLWSSLTVWSHNSISVLISDICPILHWISTVDDYLMWHEQKSCCPVRNIIMLYRLKILFLDSCFVFY